MAKESVKRAIAYARTSSATNVGTDKHSLPRQLEAISRYAETAGYLIERTFYDPAVSGRDDILTRPGFSDAVVFMAESGITSIIVESASRFARDVLVSEIGYRSLKKQGIALIAADAPTTFLCDTPSNNLVRQILSIVAEFEKSTLVARLKAARDRKKALTGKCGGRRSNAEARPEVVALAKQMRRMNPKTKKRMSLRDIGDELASAGHMTRGGKPFDAKAVAALLG